MSKRKSVLVLTPVVLSVAAVWYLWCLSLYSGKEFLSGDSIDLIDEFKDPFISKSRITKPLRSIQREKLGNAWYKLSDFGSVSVWCTFAQNPIAGHVTPRLYAERLELDRETQIFDENVQPNRWNYFDNQDFASVTHGGDPNHSNYFLDYQTDPEAKLVQISGERLENGFVFPEKFVLYALQHPLSPKIILRRDGEVLPDSIWKALPQFRMLVYQASVLSVFKMFGKSEVYRKDLYLPDGLVEFTITAQADRAGDENPKLGVYLDHKKLAEIEIARPEKAVYSVIAPVTNGTHRMELIFENDFYDARNRADRNVDLMEVALLYKPAILVKEPTEDRTYQHTIDYWTSDSASNNFYWDFFRDRKLNNEWIHSIATGVVLQEELRRSLVLTPSDHFTLPLHLGNFPHLQFGYGFKSLLGTTPGRILITIHRPFYRSKTLLSVELQKRDVWKETKLDLSDYAGKNVRLGFEIIPSNKDPFLVFLSNPVIVSSPLEAQPVDLIFLLSFDALRADHLGAYGYHRPTSPNIDAFAKESVLFENASSAATWTLPSFGSLFTSLYPSFHNARDVSKPLSHSLSTFPELIDRHGYTTAAFVQNPILHPLYGFAKGFDLFNYHISKNVEERARTSLDWLAASQGHKQFLFVHLISPHTPYTAPDRYLKSVAANPSDPAKIDLSAYSRLMNRKECELPAKKDLEDVLLMYDAEIRQADDLFQNYTQKIRELGWYDRAMIILISDHGEEFLDHGTAFHGQNVFPATSHVPLMIKFPAVQNLRGLRIPNRVSLIDVMPTILEVLGIRGPSEMQGRNLLTLIRSRIEDTEPFIFTENRKGIVGITRNNYHYVYTEPTSRGWSCPPSKLEELYDLKTDSAEIHDLSTQLPDVLSVFRTERENYLLHAEKFRSRKLGREGSRKVEPDQEPKEEMKALGYVQ